ncbi:hypothetical protein V1478_000572, partial [Vespula squamosa]
YTHDRCPPHPWLFPSGRSSVSSLLSRSQIGRFCRKFPQPGAARPSPTFLILMKLDHNHRHRRHHHYHHYHHHHYQFNPTLNLFGYIIFVEVYMYLDDANLSKEMDSLDRTFYEKLELEFSLLYTTPTYAARGFEHKKEEGAENRLGPDWGTSFSRVGARKGISAKSVECGHRWTRESITRYSTGWEGCENLRVIHRSDDEQAKVSSPVTAFVKIIGQCCSNFVDIHSMNPINYSRRANRGFTRIHTKSYAADMRMYKRSNDKPMKPSQTLCIAKEDANSRGFVPVVHKCKSIGKCEARIQAITTDEARSVDAHQRDGNTLPMLKHPLHGSRHLNLYNDDDDGGRNDSFGNGVGGDSSGVTFSDELTRPQKQPTSDILPFIDRTNIPYSSVIVIVVVVEVVVPVVIAVVLISTRIWFKRNIFHQRFRNKRWFGKDGTASSSSDGDSGGDSGSDSGGDGTDGRGASGGSNSSRDDEVENSDEIRLDSTKCEATPARVAVVLVVIVVVVVVVEY